MAVNPCHKESMRNNKHYWQTVSSQVVHTNPYYSVNQDEVIRPDGTTGSYYVVQNEDVVHVVALDSSDNIYLVQISRYTNDYISFELPAGQTDGQKPLVAGRRELREETGLTAKTWKCLGYIRPAAGMMKAKSHVYLARQLQETTNHEQREEAILKTVKIPIRQALNMVKEGKIVDGESIASLMLAALELGFVNNY